MSGMDDEFDTQEGAVETETAETGSFDEHDSGATLTVVNETGGTSYDVAAFNWDTSDGFWF